MTVRPQNLADRKDKGFTLIELLVVIVIIGILAAVAIPMFLSQREKGVDSGVKSDLKSAATAAETYITQDPSGANFGTDPKGSLEDAGLKLTKDNTIAIKGSPKDGYCIRGSNAAGTATGGTSGTYFWYDSAEGGLQSGAPSADEPGGACDTAGTFVTLSTTS
jgi:type IV pilus assembly protein PilA